MLQAELMRRGDFPLLSFKGGPHLLLHHSKQSQQCISTRAVLPFLVNLRQRLIAACQRWYPYNFF